MLSRRAPRVTPLPRYSPWSSGPRWTIVSLMRRTTSSWSGDATPITPQMPHIRCLSTDSARTGEGSPAHPDIVLDAPALGRVVHADQVDEDPPVGTVVHRAVDG